MKALAIPFLMLFASLASGQTKSNPDLKRGDNPLGVVRSVARDGTFVIERTNNGPPGGLCRVRLFGVVMAKSPKIRARATQWLRTQFVGREVRFKIQNRDAATLTATVLATDLKEGSVAEGYLVYLGLADTSRPDLHGFRYAREHAQRNRLGIWARP